MKKGVDLVQDLIPRQKIGRQIDVVEERRFNNEADAIKFFELARYRLLDINNWYSLAGNSLSKFQLVDLFGNPVERLAREGDYIKIDIPGPGTILGGGYDWVLIEVIIAKSAPGMDSLALRARPTANPLSKKMDTAHFLTEKATSTFQVKRIVNNVYAEEHGRNEKANIHTEAVVDNIRNLLVGWAASLGLSYPQWKLLVKGILEGQV
ncbi:hypothetical protein [Pedobacter xixiisoli]|uniref:Uncharacterized protein n=1 Tax=Pedobacter xixiisoli TaxID=1476464 RepID=A0A285ZUQ2_9SPHI|nr:hypothetical protein [Pedobacter xixiisoli]SOD13383.1 hypothetical protein SAMN06297358_1212 [Pedobacter xixiisoli]